MSTGIYIGRFQPFHLGHASAIKQALSQVKQLIIGIGSSQYQNTPNNPYPATLRRDMIENWLTDEKLESKCHIINLPDIHNAKKWVEHVQQLSPSFDCVFVGGEGVVKHLFTTANLPVKNVEIEHPISATQIREQLKKGDDTWKLHVPKSTLEILTNQHALSASN